MNPTLSYGEWHIIAKKYKIELFDIVEIKSGNKEKKLLRVIGLPGDKVEYQDDYLILNNQVVDEKFIIPQINQFQEINQQYTENFSLNEINNLDAIPKDYYLLLGDNRPNAYDSRIFGLVSKKNIIGKMIQ